MFDQDVGGFFNRADYHFYQAKATVDILPQDLDTLLDYLSKANVAHGTLFPMNDFNLDKKNEKNGINKDYFENILKEDFNCFDDIEDALKKDKDDFLKSKYATAKKILNSTYFSNFSGNMPQFIQQVAAKHQQDTKCNDDMTIKLMQLLHYMYASCDIGIKP